MIWPLLLGTLLTFSTNPDTDTSRRAVEATPLGLSVLGEVGWNSLAGVGLQISKSLVSRLWLDIGMGLSENGAKVGVRPRYDLLSHAVSPFLAAGITVASGNFGNVITLQRQLPPVSYSILPTLMLQAVGGVTMTFSSFTAQAAVGWAQCPYDNVRFVGPASSREQHKFVRSTHGSGLVASIATGYAF